MFVRWKVRKRKGKIGRRVRALLCAFLVKSVRIDGKPRQQTICYLGCFSDFPVTTVHGEHNVYLESDRLKAAVRFWEGAATRMRDLSLDPAMREAIDRQLLKRLAMSRERMEEVIASCDRRLAQRLAEYLVRQAVETTVGQIYQKVGTT